MNLTLPRFFWSEYRKRRTKAALITFALFWGTLSILLLMAFGQGMSAQFRVAFSGLGEATRSQLLRWVYREQVRRHRDALRRQTER